MSFAHYFRPPLLGSRPIAVRRGPGTWVLTRQQHQAARLDDRQSGQRTDDWLAIGPGIEDDQAWGCRADRRRHARPSRRVDVHGHNIGSARQRGEVTEARMAGYRQTGRVDRPDGVPPGGETQDGLMAVTFSIGRGSDDGDGGHGTAFLSLMLYPGHPRP